MCSGQATKINSFISALGAIYYFVNLVLSAQLAEIQKDYV